MTEFPEPLQLMLNNRRLERIPANPQHVNSLIDTADRHFHTARLLTETDDTAMAFTAAYDGTRKALVAVLAHVGLRVRPTGGAHRNTGIAVSLLVPESAQQINTFEWMRQIRNSTEYPDLEHPTASTQDVQEAITDGEAILSICRNWIISQHAVEN